MASACPSCRSPLVDGALRCRHCGADARAAEPVRGVAAVLPPIPAVAEAIRAAEILDELGQVAPPVAAWWRAADGPRRRRLLDLLSEIRDILRRRA